jgi:predicted Zn finger-like uncharacterized protein
MILTCPECATRYEADAAKFPPQGRDVRCAKCAHVWRQLPPEPEIEPQEIFAEPAPESEPEPAPKPQSYVQPPIQPSLKPMAAMAPQVSAAPKTPRGRSHLAGLAAGWIGLAVIVLALGAAIALYRQQVVTAWPQSASLYAGLGMKTKATGIEVDNLKYHEETEDGEPVLAVSGTLVNVGKSELPVPQIRVTLSDGDNRELYHWTFTPDILTLEPGQSIPFVTRLSSPPAAARHLDVRFAKAGE